MRKFKFDFELIKYPLITMLLMFMLKGISSTVLSETIRPLIGPNFNWLVGLMEVLQFFSTLIIQYLPFLFVLMYLMNKYNNSRIIIIFFVSFLLISTITAIFGVTNMPKIAYDPLFGLNVVTALTPSKVEIISNPYRIGFIGSFLTGIIASKSYLWTRTRTKYALFAFIDKDVLALIVAIILSLLMGVVLIYVWPVIINIIFNIIEWIGNDISNPLNTFIYGILDKVLSLFELSALNRETFWFTNVGGSWMSNGGINYLGDVSIWNATLINDTFSSGFGRYLTPYYIINLFAIPGFFIGMFSLITNKKEKINSISLIVVLLLTAVVADLSLPVEMFLFVMAPLLYFLHLAITGLLFGLLHGMGLFLGSVFPDGISNVALGNGVELFGYLNNHNLAATVITLIIIGMFVLFIYVVLTRLYYRYFAIGLINKFDIEQYVDEFLAIVGGLENIEEIDSSPFRITVKLKRPQMFDYELLEKTNIGRIIETRTEYAIYYGTASTMIRREVLIRKEIFESID